MPSEVRTSAVAGSWYPADPAALRAELDRYLAGAAPPPADGALVALISPHAGLRYSGPVAAWGYSLLRQEAPRTVVLVGPSHRALFRGVALWARGEWRTPLGVIPIDETLAERLLAAHPQVRDERAPHAAEHSLEMQLPFLQHLWPGLRIVPALMGSQTSEEVEALAAALTRVLEPGGALLVASSDLSHYQPAERAAQLDGAVIEQVRRYDPEALMRLVDSHQHACGGGPMVAVMKAAAALGAQRASILRYADSGDVEAGDKSQVVGYLSAALVGKAA